MKKKYIIGPLIVLGLIVGLLFFKDMIKKNIIVLKDGCHRIHWCFLLHWYFFPFKAHRPNPKIQTKFRYRCQEIKS